MEVILLENISNLGALGDKVDVKAGKQGQQLVVFHYRPAHGHLFVDHYSFISSLISDSVIPNFSSSSLFPRGST